VTHSRHARLAGVLLVGALALAACGSDDNGDGDSAAAAGSGATGTLKGEGSSAQKNAIDQVISSFQEANSGATVEYNPTGSGAGITQFLATQVDWAGSDSPLKSEEKDGIVQTDKAKERCGGNEAWNLPMVAGPIAVSYNLQGVDKLVLNPDVTAKMFLGKITTWNDPAIAALNDGVTLPSTPIKVFYRSDESGTTENFEKYLSATAPDVFTAEPSKQWAGTVGEGKEKSSGVAEGTKTTDGGLSYIEWSYATTNSLGVAWIDNGGGAVELTGESAGKAIAVAENVGTGNDLPLKLDYTTKEAGVYPIVLVTYEIVCSKGLAADKTTLLKSFLSYFASTQTQADLQEIGYAPLPSEIQTKVAAAVEAIS
jgi:phosphate transport system substrate-binding protein